MSCLNCPDRHLGCQNADTCEKYAALLEERAKINGLKSPEKKSADEISRYVRQSKERYKRRMGRK